METDHQFLIRWDPTKGSAYRVWTLVLVCRLHTEENLFASDFTCVIGVSRFDMDEDYKVVKTRRVVPLGTVRNWRQRHRLHVVRNGLHGYQCST